jgi:hypothetical protein
VLTTCVQAFAHARDGSAQFGELNMKPTKREMDKLERPAAGQKLYFDDELKGFGVRLTPTRIPYGAQGRVAGRTVRVPLGVHGPWTPDAARVEARKALADMGRGIDRNRQRKADRVAGVTLNEAYEAYLADRTLAENTRHDYERAPVASRLRGFERVEGEDGGYGVVQKWHLEDV